MQIHKDDSYQHLKESPKKGNSETKTQSTRNKRKLEGKMSKLDTYILTN